MFRSGSKSPSWARSRLGSDASNRTRDRAGSRMPVLRSAETGAAKPQRARLRRRIGKSGCATSGVKGEEFKHAMPKAEGVRPNQANV